MRKSTAILFSITTLIALSLPVFGWGSYAHTLIAKEALEILPEEIQSFYNANSRQVIAMSTLPDEWRQTKKECGPDHYIDLDLLEPAPFNNVVGDKETIIKRFGKEAVEKSGNLPWAIENHFEKLVQAMKNGDAVQMVVQSGVLSHYIADAHVPFHNTKDYDGRNDKEKGIHFRWEAALVSLYIQPVHLRAKDAQKVDDILPAAFDWSIDSFDYIDDIYAAEEKAYEKDPNHSYYYYSIMWQDTGDIIKDRLSRASEAVAGTFYAAWVKAGRPELTSSAAPIYYSR